MAGVRRAIVAKQLGHLAAPKAKTPKKGGKNDDGLSAESSFTIERRVVAVLYVGTRRGLDRLMLERGVSPTEHGRSWAIASSGPEHLRQTDTPIEIVFEAGYEPNAIERETIELARAKSVSAWPTPS